MRVTMNDGVRGFKYVWHLKNCMTPLQQGNFGLAEEKLGEFQQAIEYIELSNELMPAQCPPPLPNLKQLN